MSYVLVVQDDPRVGSVIKAVLRKMGHKNIGNAESYEKAIELLHKSTPVLVILDADMKDNMDRVAFTNEISDVYKIPFILITSFTEFLAEAATAKTIKPISHVLKPFTDQQFSDSVKIAMQKIASDETVSPIDEKEALLIDGEIFVYKKFRYKSLNPDKIIWIKSGKRITRINTKKRKFRIRTPTNNFLEFLKMEKFSQIHESYLINMKYLRNPKIETINIEGKYFPISKRIIKEFVTKPNKE